MQGDTGGVCNRCCNRYSSQLLLGFCCRGQVANIPLTIAFRNCSHKYCSSSDLNVLYKHASFREPKVPCSTVTDELDSPCKSLLRASQACETDPFGTRRTAKRDVLNTLHSFLGLAHMKFRSLYLERILETSFLNSPLHPFYR